MIENLREIASIREKKIKELGFGFKADLPINRKTPVCPPKFNNPLFITELKTPSNKEIDGIQDLISLASFYLDCGAGAISIPVENNSFEESLKNLINIKDRFKKTSILRKDFIQFPEEIQISYLAGADLILIVIAIFLNDKQRFITILKEIKRYGLIPLFEIHSIEEYEFLKPYNPKLVSINTNSLFNQKNSKQEALTLGRRVITESPQTKVVFESIIERSYDSYVIGASGFDGIISKNYFIKGKNSTIANLIKNFQKAKQGSNLFYQNIFSKLSYKKHLIKICGITNIDDALTYAQMGADMIGCVLTQKNPYFVDTPTLKQISKAIKSLYPDVMVIGVVSEQELKSAKELLRQNILDSLQVHLSDISYLKSEKLQDSNFSFYPCIDYEKLGDYPLKDSLPFVLLNFKTTLLNHKEAEAKLEEIKKLKQLHSKIFITGEFDKNNIIKLLELGVTMIDINLEVKENMGKDLKKLQEIFHLIFQSYDRKIQEFIIDKRQTTRTL
ncbi:MULTISPECIES: hypothetical protein [unclassified Helicobacter]|uniref:phosphoribosylanthranilate isomerase n=1 Tax=unclassified Helicobacter TaxID=2593540 RepID=UPI000CF19339|nr:MULTISPECIES: hypothetical protein [unclassified Helicobacter]